MFYKFDEDGKQIIDEETGEIEITGGGHPGAALAKRDNAYLAERKKSATAKDQTKISVAAQSIDGSYQFHMDLSDAFFRATNPGELVKNLYEIFDKHCYDGRLIPKQIVEGRILHISGSRLHSHSKKVRSSFAKKINLMFLENEKKFIQLIDRLEILHNQINRERDSTDESGSSESSEKSDPESYFGKIKT